MYPQPHHRDQDVLGANSDIKELFITDPEGWEEIAQYSSFYSIIGYQAIGFDALGEQYLAYLFFTEEYKNR
jgi:hypothetical protein